MRALLFEGEGGRLCVVRVLQRLEAEAGDRPHVRPLLEARVQRFQERAVVA